jgi:hypothetical protein
MTAKRSLPMGCIIYWSGSIGDIPSNLHLCDGTHGTPDLRNKFVPCAGGTKYAVGDTGGSASLEIPAHTHDLGSIAVQLEPHISPTVHTHQLALNVGSPSGNIQTTGGTATDSTAPDINHSHTGETQTTATSYPPYLDVEHIHSLSGELESAGPESVPKLPNYYALAFIMRIS